ncbi:MAG: anthranilate phosphoribosyltransferase [Pseudomonadales bacterium]|jgi:anthranilate phosphoribosyltransferase|nr:anthranilate phosphoribosyltransferase [Pseudomonadales bacterium]MDP7359450.1 anthranilate phosphoribosyltransferase [Pseudomonadales bacterium]MDP7595885.1 anthranilate phosphoribosyltransferase [Pseudomonadales bacterium]HJN52512.1 anthranilate phosphoribosyltransferase [Pseudomonadales bacterium]|tara:strand:+ start:1134 stop:2159 length:1026 start_codon:yes stop_codon:yes gene_type:complete
MDMPSAIGSVIDKQDLSANEMIDVMRLIMTGEATDAQIGGFLVGLRMKGETVEEIVAAATVMRELATPVNITTQHLVDTCGTGGSGSGKFNVSTASAIVAAAAGAKVAKHGNRRASSTSGSADVLEAAGVKLDITPEQVARCIENVGVGFLFALNHHSAMKHAIGPRREMITRTIFNLLGPLTNPAGAKNQLIGVYDRVWLRPIADVLHRLGSDHVMVVHSADNLDEISSSAETFVVELKEGAVSEYSITPEQFNVSRGDLADLKVDNPEESLAMVRQAIAGEDEACTGIVELNAGAAIYVSGLCDTLSAGVEMARDAIGGGLAAEKLKELAVFTNHLTEE